MQEDFRYLDELIHRGVKKADLDSDIIIKDNEVSIYKEGIRLEEDIVINGNGHVIDARGKSAIFAVLDADVTIRDAVFKNGNSHDGDEYAILNEGNLTLIGCSILDGTTGIVNDGDLTVEGCIFKDNSSDDMGGAVFGFSGNLKITDSVFKANSSDMGGAIYCGSKMILKDCTFKNNRARNGGAIYAEEEFTLKNCIFKDNNADEGGAIHSLTSGNIQDCLFEGSSAVYGGAIYNNEGNLDIIDSSFKDNQSFCASGICNNGVVNIDKCTFKSGKAKSNGGSIYNCSSAILNIFASKFLDSSSVHGGVIYNDSGAFLTVSDSKFSNNQSLENGGAIYNAFEGISSISDSSFTANTSNSGGAICNLSGDRAFSIISSVLSGNTASYRGGAIYDEGILKADVCSFENNLAASGAAIWCLDDEKLEVSDCLFRDNNEGV